MFACIIAAGRVPRSFLGLRLLGHRILPINTQIAESSTSPCGSLHDVTTKERKTLG